MHMEGLPLRALYRRTAALCSQHCGVLVVRLLAWLELTACMCVPACLLAGWLAQPTRRMHDYRLTLPVPFRPYLRRTASDNGRHASVVYKRPLIPVYETKLFDVAAAVLRF